jgi:hypothetical protein
VGTASHVEVPVVEGASRGLANCERCKREESGEMHDCLDWWCMNSSLLGIFGLVVSSGRWEVKLESEECRGSFAETVKECNSALGENE